MLREFYQFFRRLHLAVDLGAVACAYLLIRRLTTDAPVRVSLTEPALWVTLGILFAILGAATLPYEYRLRSLGFTIKVITQRWALMLALSLAVFFLRPDWALDRVSMSWFVASGLVVLILIRIAAWTTLGHWRRSGRSYKNALIIGTGTPARELADSILAQPERGLRAIGFLDNERADELWRYRDIPLRGTFASLPRLIKTEQIDFVLFALDGHSLAKRHGLVRLCTRMGVPTVIITDWFSKFTARQRSQAFLGHSSLTLDTAPRPGAAVIVKSILDRALAFLGLLLAAPIMAIAAVAIKITSRGPVFFSQVRMGLNGRRFRMWKFRTMNPDAESQRSALEKRNEMSGAAFKLTDDPRITPIGRILRRSSIDELPQLFNVLGGDMSLVGPRPPLPDEVSRYREWQRRRLAVKPGLTCLWQIGGRSDIDFDEWMRLDLKYIDDWSMKKDAEILVKTVPAVIRGSGAR